MAASTEDSATATSPEKDQPEVRTEYAFVRDGAVVMGPTSASRWNDELTLQEAAELWYPGAEVVSRTRTVFPDVLTSWQAVSPEARSETS